MLDQITGAATEVLGETEVYQRLWVDLYSDTAAAHPDVDPMVFVDAMLESDWDALALAAKGALDYVEGCPWPLPGAAWSRELIAAWLVLDIFAFASKVRKLRRKLVGRNTLDLVGISELVWIALRIGALSEAFAPGFRPSSGTFGDLGQSVSAAEKALADREKWRNKATEASVLKADKWRVPGLKRAIKGRTANKIMGDEPLAKIVFLALLDLKELKRKPAEATVRRQIRTWVRAGALSPSLSRRPRGG